MSSRETSVLADEAQEILSSTLNEIDKAHLNDIYRDITREIRWGKVLEESFPPLLEKIEELLGREDISKNGSPWYLVDDSDKALFDDEDPKAMARRHSLALLLAKKLVGGLKTRINQSLADISILSVQDELDLEEFIEGAVDLEREHEYDLTAEDERALEVERETIVDIDISPSGGGCQNGKHPRTVVSWKRTQQVLYKVTRCKDCRSFLSQEVLTRKEGKGKIQGPCTHPSGIWVEGQEGRNAICGACREPLPNPETYRWLESGLEPYGDDPAKDEVITLCSNY